jgi:hypothetical protein
MQQEAAAPSEEPAARPRFIVPSPATDTDSDDDVPQSAQGPNGQHRCNSDNAEEATISIPIVHAEIVQTAGPDDSASHRDLLHPACIAQLHEEDGGHEVEEEAEESDSELRDTGRKRRRRLPDGIRRPRMHWRTLEVISRSEHSDEEIQNRLNEIARTVYEKAGTAYPPSIFDISDLFLYLRQATNSFVCFQLRILASKTL